MSAPKTKVLILIGLVAVSVTAVYMQELANARLRAQLDGLRRGNAQITAALEKEVIQTNATLAKSKEPTEIVTLPATEPADVFPHSESYERLSLQFREQLGDNYGALFRRLNLSPDKQVLLENLLIDKRIAESHIAYALSSGQYQGLDPNDLDALRALTAAGTEDIDGQIQQVLGPAPYEQYEHYDDTLMSRQQINAFAAQLKHTGSPLSDTQADQLVDLLAQANSDPTVPLPDSFQAQAAAILNPAQGPALKTLAAALQARRTILAMNRAALSKGTLPQPAPAIGAGIRLLLLHQ
jgi:hypothetical protein